MGRDQRRLATRAQPQFFERQYFRYTDQHWLVPLYTASYRSDSAIRSAEFHDHNQPSGSTSNHGAGVAPDWYRQPDLSQYNLNSIGRYRTPHLGSSGKPRFAQWTVVGCSNAYHQRDSSQWESRHSVPYLYCPRFHEPGLDRYENIFTGHRPSRAADYHDHVHVAPPQWDSHPGLYPDADGYGRHRNP